MIFIPQTWCVEDKWWTTLNWFVSSNSLIFQTVSSSRTWCSTNEITKSGWNPFPWQPIIGVRGLICALPNGVVWNMMWNGSNALFTKMLSHWMSHIGPIFCISHLQLWWSSHAWLVFENTGTPLAPLFTAPCWDKCFASSSIIFGSSCEGRLSGWKNNLAGGDVTDRAPRHEKVLILQKWIKPGQLSTFSSWSDSIRSWQCDKLYFDQPFLQKPETN